MPRRAQHGLANTARWSGARPGTVLVESSTLSVPWVTELAAAAEALGCALLDAPVTGSKPQAANGELLFLVGGAAAVLDSVRDVLAPDEPRRSSLQDLQAHAAAR